MKLVNLTCPNCNGLLERVGDNLFCKSCGSAFGIDYDSSDVEYEKLQTEEERAQREFEHEKELLELRHRQEEQSRIAAEKRYNRRETKKSISRAITSRISKLFALLLVIGFFYGSYKLSVRWGVIPTFSEIIASAKATKASPYDVKVTDVTDDVLETMIDSANSNILSKKEKGVTETSVNKKKKTYTLESAEYDSAYLITNSSSRKNRIVILFKLTYTASDETKVTYDGCYFDNIKLKSDGTLHSDYNPRAITKGKSSWHNDSYEDREQCYRENVKGIEGNAFELKRNKK